MLSREKELEINRLVHVHVFGNPFAWMVPPYCSSRDCMLKVVERMESRADIKSSVFTYGEMELYGATFISHDGSTFSCGGDARGEAICAAALMALGQWPTEQTVTEVAASVETAQ